MDWGSIIAAAIAAYSAKNQSPGKFTQVPEDPSLTAIRKKVLGFVDNSPTRDFMGGLIAPRLANAQGWNAPPDKYGYGINSVPAPKYDLSKLIPSITPPTTPPQGSKPGIDGTAGGAKTGPSPMKVEGPLNKDIVFDNEFGGGGGPSDDQSIYDFLSQNPGGHPQNYLRNGGQSGTTPYGDFVHSPAMSALQDQYGADPNFKSLWDLTKKYGPTILASYFLGPLAPIATKIFTAITGQNPSTSTTGSGFIPGSISGQPPPAGKP